MKQKRKTVHSLALVPAALALLLAACSGNNSSTGPSDPSANFSGKVVRAAASGSAAADVRAAATPATTAVAGAQVIVDGAATGVYTDDEGEFTLTLAPGPHTISVVVAGSTSQTLTVNIDGLSAVTVEMELKADGTIVADEDVNHDGEIDSDDDSDHDGDIDDNDDDDSDDDDDDDDDDDEQEHSSGS